MSRAQWGGGTGGVLGRMHLRPQSKHRTSLRADFTADPSNAVPRRRPNTDEAGGPALFLVGLSTATCTAATSRGSGRCPAGWWEGWERDEGEPMAPTGPCRQPPWDTAPLKASAPLESIFCGAGRHRSRGPATTAPSCFCHHWTFL